MQPDESGREDILREATALVRRIELQLPNTETAPVVAGFRRNGALSIFFDADPVYQFNADCQLRRIYLNGRLVKAERGRLVSLRREKREGETVLWRTELTADETEKVISDMHQRLAVFHNQLQNGQFQITGQQPTEDDIAGHLGNWLAALPQPAKIASTPRV